MVNSRLSIYYVVSVLAAVCHQGLAFNSCPRHRGLPAGLARAENRIDGRALFWLDLREAINGCEPEQEYTLRVQTTSKEHKFNDATITVDAINSLCGHGQWVIDSASLYSPQGCPDIVTTEQKHPMGRALFKWRSPRCGCVHFRVRVHADSLYYIEDENSKTGALAKTVCVNAKDDPSLAKESAVTTEIPVQDSFMSRDERLQLLCEVNKKHEPKLFGTPGMSFSPQDHVNLLLQQRKHVTDLCCQEDAMSNVRDCFYDVRRRRIDQFCATGETATALTKLRQQWAMSKRSQCCLEIGEYRYECFDASSHGEEMLKDDQGVRQSFYSLDVFDPVNDLDDFDETELKRPKSNLPNDGQNQATKVSNAGSQFLADGQARRDLDQTRRDLDQDESPLDDSEGPVATEERDSGDVEDEEDDVSREDDTSKGRSRQRSKKYKRRCASTEQCCWKGIDAAFAGETQNIADCFAEADRREKHWDRACDRSFVICCLRVIDKLTPGQMRV